MQIDPQLTLACACWFAFIGASIAAAAFERRRVASKARALRENRAAIDRAKADAAAIEMANDMRERGRE